MPDRLNTAQQVELRLIRNQLPSQAREVLKQLHGADIADLFPYFTKAERETFITMLIESDQIASVLAEIDEETFAIIREHLVDEKLVQILQNMPTDDAADLINFLGEDERENIFRSLTGKQKRAVGQLLGYAEDTAGGIMTTEVHAFRDDMTVGEAIEKLRHEEQKEVVLAIYIISAHQRLVGMTPFKSLIFATPEQTLSQVMIKDPPSIQVDASAEAAAKMFSQYDLLSLPVVDENVKLVGVITVDDAIDVINDEVTEDMFHLANLDAEERVHTPVARSLRMRLPWMLFNLVTASCVATTIHFFTDTLSQFVSLTVLMPVVAGMGGNAGTQALTVTVRGLALGEIDFTQGMRLIFKEIRIGLFAGLVVGLVVGVLSSLFFHNYWLGMIAFSAMVMNLVLACLAGSFIPLALKKFNLDPALGSSMFVTMCTDVGGYFSYLGLATLFMDKLVT